MPDLSKWGPATVLVVGLVLTVALVGGVVVVVNPETLSFKDYIAALVGAGVASGLLGVGRGIHLSNSSAVDDDEELLNVPTPETATTPDAIP